MNHSKGFISIVALLWLIIISSIVSSGLMIINNHLITLTNIKELSIQSKIEMYVVGQTKYNLDNFNLDSYCDSYNKTEYCVEFINDSSVDIVVNYKKYSKNLKIIYDESCLCIKDIVVDIDKN